MRSLTFLLSHFATYVCVHIYLCFSFSLILLFIVPVLSENGGNGVDLVSAVLVSVVPDWGQDRVVLLSVALVWGNVAG